MPTGDQVEVETLCSYLPGLVRDPDITKWERGFVVSLIGQRRRFPGRPLSEKQVVTLRRLVRSFQERWLRDGVRPDSEGWQSVGSVAADLAGRHGDGG